MKILLITLWLLIPLGIAAYHYGPGQDRLERDYADEQISLARHAIEEERWDEAIAAYQDALSYLSPSKEELIYRIQIEIAKLKMQNAGLPQARQELIELVDRFRDGTNVSKELQEDALAALANARYYMTYLMKLEGQPPSEWEPEIEAARQEYKFLAETGKRRSQHLADLEAAILLARADPKELYGLPIPVP